MLALVAARLLNPTSKLATSTALNKNTATDTLGAQLDLNHVDEHDLYEAMDWLTQRKHAIERRLARRHLHEGSLVLCTSTYVEGQALELAAHGYSRDGKKHIVLGLLTDRNGCPVAVEVLQVLPVIPKRLPTSFNQNSSSSAWCWWAIGGY